MADIISVFHTFPPDGVQQLKPAEYDREIRNFLHIFTQIPEHSLVRAYETQPDILDGLDPSINTIPYLKILISLIRAYADKAKSVKTIPETFQPGKGLWNKIVFFLERFDPVQVRYVGQEWRGVVDFIDNIAGILEQPRAALKPIRTAILRLDPSGGTLTSTHLRFVRLCLRSRDYAQAVPVLDLPILGFPGSTSSAQEGSLPCSTHAVSSAFVTLRSSLSERLSVQDVQEYFLLGAMAYLGVRRYKDALLYLEHVLSTPTSNIVTGLMLEAYKKWVLVSYLANGKMESLPKSLNAPALKTIRAASCPYEVLGKMFSNAHDRLQAEAEEGAALWSEDGNTGLVQVFVQHHVVAYMQSLANVYSAIPLAEIAPWIGMDPSQTEAYLRSLLADGLLNASIEGGNGAASGSKVLRFYYDPTTGPLAKSEKQRFEELVRQSERTNMLTEQVRVADHRLHLTKEYLDHHRKRAVRDKNMAGAGGPDDHHDSALEQMNDHDEDMMADLH